MATDTAQLEAELRTAVDEHFSNVSACKAKKKEISGLNKLAKTSASKIVEIMSALNIEEYCSASGQQVSLSKGLIVGK